MIHHKIYLSFILTCTTEDPDQLSAAVGLEPDASWRIGDPVRNTTMKKKYNGWQVDSGCPVGAELDDHLDALMSRLWPAVDALRARPPSWQAVVSCALYMYDSPPAVNFGATAVRFFADLGAVIDVDLYCLQDGAD